MYKFTDGLLPPGFKDYFCTQSDIHTYNTATASRSAISISFARTNKSQEAQLSLRGGAMPRVVEYFG